jgi:hypothetical protein
LAKTNTAKRKIYYRKAEFNSPQKRTLQQMAADALSKHVYVQDRLETLGADAKELRVISRYVESKGFLFGQLVVFERGSFQTVISDNPTAKNLALSAVSPPVINKVQQQYVPGVLYFGLYKNHVVILQSVALRASALEQHLAWLIRTKSNILGAQDGFVLKDEPQPATKTKIRKSHVKSVSIGRPLMSESAAPDSLKLGTGVTKFKPVGEIVNLLKGMLKDSDSFEKLGLEDAQFDSNLEVWIEIRYPKRQRSQAENSIKLLDNLGIALRDIDEDQTKLLLGDNSVVYGKDLKISSAIEIAVDDKGLPKEDDLYSEMHSWLHEQLKNGIISPG